MCSRTREQDKQGAQEREVGKRRIIMIGNQRSGKSTLFSEITRKASPTHFENRRFTKRQRIRVVTINEIDYVDTGSAHIQRGYEYAEQVSVALNEGWRRGQAITIIFIVTLSPNGGVWAQDLQMVASVRDAIRRQQVNGGIENQHHDAVIVNECDAAMVGKINANEKVKNGLLETFGTPNALPLPCIDENDIGMGTVDREDVVQHMRGFVQAIPGMLLEGRVSVIFKDHDAELRRAKGMKAAVARMHVAGRVAKIAKAKVAVGYGAVAASIALVIVKLLRLLCNSGTSYRISDSGRYDV